MKSLIMWAVILGGGYYLYTKYASTATPAGLPAGSQIAQTFTVLGQTINLYLANNGYYVQTVGSNGAILETLGPYTQAQATTALAAKNVITGLLTSL